MRDSQCFSVYRELVSEWIGLKEKLHEAEYHSRIALLLMALAVWTEPALARSYLNCLTKKVVIVEAPRGSTSSSIEESLGFWIDEAAETVVLADGSPLTVRRFDAAGLALLAAICPTSSIVKMAI